MSNQVNVLQKIAIDNEDGQAEKLLKKLQKHFEDLFNSKDLSYLEIRRFELHVDDDEAELLEEDSGYEMEIDVSGDMEDLLSALPDAEQVYLFADYVFESDGDQHYGHEFFSRILKDGMQDYVSYVCLEYSEENPNVITNRFGVFENGKENGPAPEVYDESFVQKVARSANSWRDGNFKMAFSIPGNTDEIVMKVIDEKLNHIVSEYNLTKVDEYSKEGRCYGVYAESLHFNSDEVISFTNSFKPFVDFINHCDGRLKTVCTFVPDDTDPNLSAIRLNVVDSKVIVTAVDMNGDL